MQCGVVLVMVWSARSLRGPLVGEERQGMRLGAYASCLFIDFEICGLVFYFEIFK